MKVDNEEGRGAGGRSRPSDSSHVSTDELYNAAAGSGKPPRDEGHSDSSSPTERRLALRDLGYHPLPANGKAPKLPGWQKACRGASPEAIRSWASRSDEINTGVLCGAGLAVVDCDVSRPDLAGRIEAAVLPILGATPIVRIGRAPKWARLYRVEGALRKRKTEELYFRDQVAPDGSVKTTAEGKRLKAAAFEVLGDGQQAIVDGIHPDTGHSYEYPKASIFDVPVADLPLVTEEILDRAKAAAERVLREAGGLTEAEWKAVAKGPNAERVRDALLHLPSDDRGFWIKIGLAIKEAFGDDGFEIWDEWSKRSSSYDPDEAEKTWETLDRNEERRDPSETVTIGTLLFHAREAGWKPKRGRPAKAGAMFNPSADPSIVAGEDLRPIVQVIDGRLPEVVDRVERLMIEAGAEIYVRGEKLVVPKIETVPAADERETTSATTVAITVSGIADKAARLIRFTRYDGRSRDYVDTNVPEAVSRTLHERQSAWNFARLTGIANTPILMPNGEILSKPGYDPRTKIYLATDPDFVLPPIPERPTLADAEAALGRLDALLDEFPFVESVDRAVALSGILTALIRGGIPTAPMHIFRAYTPGTGKSYLVDLISAIATGRLCPVMAAGSSEEETEKRLGAHLLKGGALLSIDNLNGTLRGDTLCQMLTQTAISVRILGKSEMPLMEVRTAMFATGNNLKVAGDMVRRAVLSTLDAGVERPEERQFGGDPIKTVMADRGRYVADAYTVIRAYMAAGSPKVSAGSFGSYEAWSAMVRAPLLWLGKADPVESLKTARDEDPDLTDIGQLFAEWDAHMLRDEPYTSARLIEISEGRGSGFWGDASGSHLRPDLHGVLLRRAGYGTRIDARRVGNWLSQINGRVVNGLRLEMKKDPSHGNKFTLIAVKDSDGSTLDVPLGKKLGPKRGADEQQM